MNFGNGSMGFSDQGGGGPGSTPSWQQTLDVGNTSHTELIFDDPQPNPPFPDLATKVWMEFEPLVVTGFNDTNFYWNQISQKNENNGAFAAGNNNVINFGWNMAPGGGSVVGGVAGIGLQFEGNYFPDTEQMVEHHTFYLTPAGAQVRLDSFTIRTATNNFDYYITSGQITFKEPSSFQPYLGITGGVHGASIGWVDAVDNTKTASISVDFTGAVHPIMYVGNFTGPDPQSIVRVVTSTIQMPSLIAAAGVQLLQSNAGSGIILPDVTGGGGLGWDLGRNDLKFNALYVLDCRPEYLLAKQSTVNPTTGDIPLQRWQMWQNTTLGETRLWCNEFGVLKSVLLT